MKITPKYLYSRFRASTFLSVTASCDHRVIDGAEGAIWLKNLREILDLGAFE